MYIRQHRINSSEACDAKPDSQQQGIDDNDGVDDSIGSMFSDLNLLATMDEAGDEEEGEEEPPEMDEPLDVPLRKRQGQTTAKTTFAKRGRTKQLNAETFVRPRPKAIGKMAKQIEVASVFLARGCSLCGLKSTPDQLLDIESCQTRISVFIASVVFVAVVVVVVVVVVVDSHAPA